jgi:hypothetical protein
MLNLLSPDPFLPRGQSHCLPPLVLVLVPLTWWAPISCSFTPPSTPFTGHHYLLMSFLFFFFRCAHSKIQIGTRRTASPTSCRPHSVVPVKRRGASSARRGAVARAHDRERRARAVDGGEIPRRGAAVRSQSQAGEQLCGAS